MRDASRLSRRGRTVIALSVLASLDSNSLFASTQTSTWIGPAGSNWNNAANWSPSGVPNNGTNGFTDYNVIIGSPSPTLLDINATIDSLTINASAQLTINPAQILTVDGPTVSNNGLIQIDTLNQNAMFNVSGNTLLTGSGVTLLNDYSPNAVLVTTPAATLTQDVNSKIGGVGEIDANLINNGTVNANFSSQSLVLQTFNMSNNALFEASNGGTLAISNIKITQGTLGQTLAAAGSFVTFNNTNVSGGMITSQGNGSISVTNSTFNNVNISAGSLVIVQPATTLNISGGSLINSGVIQLDTNTSNANLNFTTSTSVTGSGSIYLYDNSPRPTINASTGAIVTLSSGQSVLGEGTINASLVNNGIVNANVSNQSILLQTNAMTNNHLLEATNGGSLNITGITLTQGTGGQIYVGTGSGANITGSTIAGGMLNASAGTVINLTSSTLANVNVATGTMLLVTQGTNVDIAGSLINNGVIQVDQNAQNANLNFNNSTSVTGNGSFYLFDNNPRPTINTSAGATVTFSSGQTIYGEGTINASLINNGTINANVSNQSILLQTNAMTNNNILEATAGGTLSVNGITLTQAPGATLTAYNSSTIALTGGANISGGLLSATATGSISVSNATFNNVNIATGTQVTVQGSQTLNVTGSTLINNGLIQVDTLNGSASINFNTSNTISGTGSIFLDDYTPNAKLVTAAGTTLTQSTGNTIYGVGEIDAALINNGTVNATLNNQTLFMQNGPVTNNGTLEATNGAILNLNGIAITQAAAGIIKTDASSSVSINSTNISNGTIASANGGAINVNTANFNSVNISTGTQINVAASTTLAFTGSISTGNGIGLSIANAAVTTFAPAASVSNRALVVLSSLSDSGRLDLGNNDMDVVNGNLTTITQLLAAGANTTQGNFNGPSGITSISAANNTTHLFALGSIQNNQSGTALFTASRKFDNFTPGAADILVKYTYFGDANLDGKVDASDYSRIDSAFISEKTGPAVTTWFNGDFNYDGVVNGSDYTLIDNAFNNQGAQVTSQLASATSQIASLSAVPEPASIGIFLLTAGLLGRRRCRI